MRTREQKNETREARREKYSESFGFIVKKILQTFEVKNAENLIQAVKPVMQKNWKKIVFTSETREASN